MATYVVTLKQGFGKTGKSRSRENRTVTVVASDSKTPGRSPKQKAGRQFRRFRQRRVKKNGHHPFPRKPLIIMCKSLAAMLDARSRFPRPWSFTTPI